MPDVNDLGNYEKCKPRERIKKKQPKLSTAAILGTEKSGRLWGDRGVI